MPLGDRPGQTDGLREARAEARRQALEAGPPLVRDRDGGVVGAEPARVVVLVERHQLGDEPRHPRVAPQRRVLGPGQLQPPGQLDRAERRAVAPSAYVIEGKAATASAASDGAAAATSPDGKRNSS